MFVLKDFEVLHRDKILYPDEIPVFSKYFFSFENNFIFIKKSRRFYKVMASSCCGFEPTFRESVFDCLYYSEKLSECVDMFKSYVSRLLCRVYHH